MRKEIILSSLVAMLVVALMASVAVAGPRVAIVKADDSKMDLVLNSYHNTLPDIYYQEPPAGNAGIRPSSEWSKESELAIEKMVREAVKLAGGWPVKRGDKVLMKVNSVGNTYTLIAHGFGDDASIQGAYTDARVARAAALLALESGAREVIIGEGPGIGGGMANLRELGFDRMVEELNNPKVRIVDLGDPPWKWYRAPKALALDKYAMHEVVGEADKIINIPCLKTHILCGVTSALKNTGIGLPTDEIYGTIKMGLPHAKVVEVITDVNMIAPSDYVIVDALWGLEEDGPIIGPGVPMGLIIAGSDPVACDAVSTVVMGFKVTNIGTTVMAEQHGLGTYRNINVVGRPISEVQKAFTPPHRRSRWPAEHGNILGWDSQAGRTLDDL
jgi:uncharacterized protein (DUF362 family)